jgi:mono/diheme cytochrome c family protein
MEYIRRVRALPAAIAVLALLVGGCGGGSSGSGDEGPAPTDAAATAQGDPRQGHIIYIEQGCSNCHNLKDTQSGEIGRGGIIGPDLDEAKPSYDLVVERVTNGKGQMPAFDTALTEVEIRDVAAYVASVAGK